MIFVLLNNFEVPTQSLRNIDGIFLMMIIINLLLFRGTLQVLDAAMAKDFRCKCGIDSTEANNQIKGIEVKIVIEDKLCRAIPIPRRD